MKRENTHFIYVPNVAYMKWVFFMCFSCILWPYFYDQRDCKFLIALLVIMTKVTKAS